MDALKEVHPSPSSAPKLFFSQPIKKQKKDFNQEKTEIDIMREEMQKMKKEMLRLDSVAKDEQRKRTIAEQRLEQKTQEGVTVFKRHTSKLPPNAFASKIPATTSRMPTSQLMPAELSKKATEKIQLLRLSNRRD